MSSASSPFSRPFQKLASGRNGFLAMVGAVQRGEKPLHGVSPSVTTAAKRMHPKDSSVVPTPPLGELNKFALVFLAQKRADVMSSIMTTHKAIHAAGAARRDVLGKHIETLQKHNEKLVAESEKSKADVVKAQQDNLKIQQKLQGEHSKIQQKLHAADQKSMSADLKAHSADMKSQQAEQQMNLANTSVEEMQAAQMANRTPPPPEQPPYGAMLLNGQLGPNTPQQPQQ